MLPFGPGTGITNSGTPDRPGAKWKRNFANPGSELPAQAPVPTHRYKPREVRRQGYPRESRSPSRRVVVKLGSWSACADGAPRQRGAPSSYPRTPGRATPGDRPLQGPATASSRSFVGPMNRAGNPRQPFPKAPLRTATEACRRLGTMLPKGTFRANKSQELAVVSRSRDLSEQ